MTFVKRKRKFKFLLHFVQLVCLVCHIFKVNFTLWEKKRKLKHLARAQTIPFRDQNN